MIQLILHLWGDYLLQSSWMAENKAKRWLPALAHATAYSLPFLLIGSWEAVLVIWATHALIDRFRLARFVVFAKNFLAPRSAPVTRLFDIHNAEGVTHRKLEAVFIERIWPYWKDSKETGYPSSVPTWLAGWLLIIADNTLHLTINFLALRWL